MLKSAFLFFFLLGITSALRCEGSKLEELMENYAAAETTVDSSDAIQKISLYYYDNGSYSTAIEWMLMGYEYNKENNNTAGMQIFATNLGVLNIAMENFEVALKFLRITKQLSAGKEMSNEIEFALYSNSAYAYERLNKVDSADFFYQKCLGLVDQIDDPIFKATVYGNYGNFLAEQGDIKGLEYDEKALAFSLASEHRNVDWSSNVLNVARDYLSFQQSQKALDLLDKVGPEIEANFGDQALPELYSQVHEQLGNHALAFDYYKQFIAMRDSTQKFEKEAAREKLHLFEKQQTAAELNQLRLENELEKAETEKKEALSIGLFFSSCLLLGFIAMLGFFLWKNKKQRKLLAEQNEALQLERQQLELRALLAQIKPHFIFNVLNSIQKFIAKNDRDSSFNYLGLFGRMMRTMLEHSNTPFVVLQDEIDSLSDYVEMEKLRFDKPLKFHIKIQSGINPYEIRIPPMLIQPFIENAIWHGLSPLDSGGSIELSIHSEDEVITCEVRDDGIGYPTENALPEPVPESGAQNTHGLSITRQRLSVIWSKFGHVRPLVIANRLALGEGRGTLVRFEVPTDFF